MLTGLLGDVRLGLRVLLKSRIPTLVMITTLAVAVGANTALFSIVHQVLLAPLGFSNEEQVYFLWQGPGRGSVSPRNYLDWKQASQLMEMSAFDSTSVTLTGTSVPKRLNALQTSHDFLDVLGVPLLEGRFFSDDEDRPGGTPVVVISSRLWRREFFGNPDILGTRANIDGITREIIGVLPDDFEFLGETRQNRLELILPIAFTDHQREESQRGAQWIGVVGRLVPGRTESQAKQEFSSIIDQLQTQTDRIPDDFEVSIVPAREEIVGDVQIALWSLFGAVGLVLAVALLNITALLLARASARRGEFAVRSALGATAVRMARQALIESLLVALLSGGLGFLLAVFTRDLLVTLAPEEIPRLAVAELNTPVLLFCFMVTAGAGLFLGLIPAGSARRVNLTDALADLHRSALGSSISKRFSGVLVVAEIGLAVVVLSTAGLLARSLLKLEQVEPGFNLENVVRFRLSLPESLYDSSPRVDSFYKELLARLREIPGVTGSGAVMQIPLGADGDVFGSFGIENRQAPEGTDFMASLRPVTPGYFSSMGISMLRGRDFQTLDDLAAPGVMIVNQAFVQRFFPEEDPLGRRVRPHVGLAERSRQATIVGVVGDVHHSSLAREPEPVIYIPHSQSPVGSMSVVVSSNSSVDGLEAAISRVVRELDPELPIYGLNSLSKIRSLSLASPRFQTFLFGSFALLALFLAAVGVFGLMSYRITARTAEIGVRKALGAQDSQILMLIVWQGLVLTMAGLILGLVASFLAGSWVQSLLFNVEPTDPVTIAVLSLVLTVTALAATLQPARKALKIPPLRALRGSESKN